MMKMLMSDNELRYQMSDNELRPLQVLLERLWGSLGSLSGERVALSNGDG